MRRLLFLLFFLVTTASFAQNWLWANGSTAGAGEGWNIAVDDSDNIYETGYFITPTLAFGATVLSNNATGTSDIFLAKFNSSGTLVWARRTGMSGTDEAFGVTTDNEGGVYITGDFYSDTLFFASDTLVNYGNGWSDFFVAKYDNNGNEIWAKRAGGNSTEKGTAASFDRYTGTLLVTGNFSSPSITFGTTTLVNQGSSNTFLTKYNLNGNVVWAQSGGGGNLDGSNSVCTDKNGNVFITGYLTSNLSTFGSVIINTNVTATDVFLVKYNSSGNALWGFAAGSPQGAYGYDVATDTTGNCFLTGYYDSTVTLGTFILNTAAANASNEAFIADVDSTGFVIWAKSSADTTTNDATSGYGVATDPSGNVYMVGGFMHSTEIVFDQDTLQQFTTEPSFIVEYDPSGNLLCASSLSGAGDDNIGVAVGNSAVYIGGDYLGTTMAVGPDTLIGNVSENIFVASYSCEPSGTNDISENSAVSIYPNPSSGIFSININEISKPLHLYIYDTFGRIILQRELSVSETAIDFGVNAGGMYFYTIAEDQKILKCGRLIIN